MTLAETAARSNGGTQSPNPGAERRLYGPFCARTHPLRDEQRRARRRRFKGVRLQVAHQLLTHSGSYRVTADKV